MPPLKNIEEIRAQFGIPQGGLVRQNTLNNRVSSLDSAWGSTPTMQQSTQEPVKRNIVFDTLAQGAKRLIAGGIQGSETTPATFGEAITQGVSNREKSLEKQFAFNPQNPAESGLNDTLMGFAGSAAPSKVGKAAEPIFEGFKDLSTKLLKDLEGRAKVSKQYLLDATNRPELKQPEKDLFRNLLKDEGDDISVSDFANKVKSELLPLEIHAPTPSYESISLPDELRGPVANYTERVYQSPIQTSAGNVHFSGRYRPTEAEINSGKSASSPQNYFAHTRIEDLPSNIAKDNEMFKGTTEYDPDFNKKYPGNTRRVIELQSDLFQKGRLEDEVQETIGDWRPDQLADELADMRAKGEQDSHYYKELLKIQDDFARRSKELAPLEPYRNTWHERVIREEVKQAAKDGKTKLQFPTGETAMKIERLGDIQNWEIPRPTAQYPNAVARPTEADLKVGQEMIQGGDTEWIITDVLGDGKFKAVPKDKYGNGEDARLVEANFGETFDISGKVDTENPIYKFYEKTVQKYLTNKYGGKVITDPQGVKWVEIDIKPEYKGMPVEAFGALLAPFAPLYQQSKEKKEE